MREKNGVILSGMKQMRFRFLVRVNRLKRFCANWDFLFLQTVFYAVLNVVKIHAARR